MFCQNNKTFLEVDLPSENVSDLLQFSEFCKISIDFVRYASIPVGLTIILLTTSAFIALKSRFKMSHNGTGVIFMAVLVMDFLNGFMCLRLFEQTMMREVISFNNDVATKTLEWLTWHIIFTSWLLKFFLCFYELHKFLKGSLAASWYPARPNFNRPPEPLSKTQGCVVVVASCVISLLEMTIMFLLKKYRSEFSSAITVPFLGIQNVLLWVCSLFVAALCFFTRYNPSDNPSTRELELFVTSTIGLNCLFTILSDSFLAYGDLSCLFKYEPPTNMKPMCYSILARFLSYADSIFFSVVQFRSKAVRRYFMDAIGCTRQIPGAGHLYEPQAVLPDSVSGPMHGSYPVNTDDRNEEHFRRVTVNDDA